MNLPGESVQWGRQMQRDQVELKKAYLATQQSIDGMNRNTAAQLAGIADQLTDISELLESQVKVEGDSSTETNWPLSSTTWTTLATTALIKPTWAQNAVVTVAGSMYIVSNNEFAVPSFRLRIGGVPSMESELPPGVGASAIPFYGSTAFTKEINNSPDLVVCDIQAYVLNYAHWYSGAENRKAQVSATAVFTR